MNEPSVNLPRRHRRSMRWAALTAVVLAAVTGLSLRYAGVLAAVAPVSAVRNGSMEEVFIGGIALGWDNNCWGDVSASFSREERKPRLGRSAQKIHCERVGQGAAQIRQLGISLRAGQPYTLTVWMRGTVDGPIFVGVRQNEAPYKRYLVQNVRVSEEWRRYVITATPDADAASAGIYIAFSAPGDLWIDDVELREGAAESTAAITSIVPEKKGNLLYNSGFELGVDGWGPVARVRADSTGALQGKRAARCAPGWEPILLESRPVVIRPGQRHTISANLKASGPAEVEMVVMEYADEGGDRPGQRDAIREVFSIDRKWRRVSLSGVLNGPLVNGYVVQLNLRSGAQTVWADALQWEEGDLSSYRPAANVEVAVRAASRLLAPGQGAVTECEIARAPTAPKSVAVTYRLEDSDGKPVAEQTLQDGADGAAVAVKSSKKPLAKTTPVAPKSKIQNPKSKIPILTWSLPRPGIYRVVGTPSGTPVGRSGQAVFCQFARSLKPGAAQRIGIHGWSNPDSPNSAVKAAAYLGAGGYRLHDFRSFVQWYEVEPTEGQYVWHDKDVADLSRRGYRMLGTLCRTPPWAAREGNEHALRRSWSTSPPRDWEAWSRYVQAVVRRYRGQIQAWEVWNEPWGKNFWTGTPAEYVEMMNRTRSIIKGIDPTTPIVGGCFSPDFPNFTQAVLRAGGLSAMDVVSYHDYLSPDRVVEPANGGAPTYYQAAATLRTEVRRRGGEQPLWCTETGLPSPGFYSWLPKQGPRYSTQVAVSTLVKGVTLQLAAGVERIYYYHMGGVEWSQGYPSRMLNAGYTLLDFDGSPKPTLPALAQAVAMLGEAEEPTDLSTAELRAYAFRRGRATGDSAYVAVVWMRKPGTDVALPPLAKGITMLDAMGARLPATAALGDRPIYLLGASREALERVVQAL